MNEIGIDVPASSSKLFPLKDAFPAQRMDNEIISTSVNF